MGFVSVFQSTIIRIPVIEQVGFIIEAERTHTMGTVASQEKGDGNKEFGLVSGDSEQDLRKQDFALHWMLSGRWVFYD